jgi:hypothetical protein
MRARWRQWSLLVLLLGAGLAWGNDGADAAGRTLGGYRYIPSDLVPNPFIVSHFRNATGAALAMNERFPVLVVDQDTLLALSGDVAFLSLSFELQHAVDDRVAFRIGGAGTSRLGTGAESILTQGVTAVTSFDMGTSVRVWNDDRILLTATADAAMGSVLAIDVFQYVEDVIDSGFERASLTKSDNGLTLDGGLRSAWTLRPWAGLMGLLKAHYFNTVRRDEAGWGAGIAGSIDFGQKHGPPVGLLASAVFDEIRFDPNEKSEVQLGAGVFYTGREDFSVGLELGYFRKPLRTPKVVLDGMTFRINAQYYF